MLKGSGFAKVASDLNLIDVGNTKKVEFSVSTKEKRKNVNGDIQEEISFFNVEAWDSAASFLYDNCEKGYEIYIEFILRKDRWEKDGVKKSRDVLRLTYFRIL